jgi:hypothetical protein
MSFFSCTKSENKMKQDLSGELVPVGGGMWEKGVGGLNMI